MSEPIEQDLEVHEQSLPTPKPEDGAVANGVKHDNDGTLSEEPAAKKLKEESSMSAETVLTAPETAAASESKEEFKDELKEEELKQEATVTEASGSSDAPAASVVPMVPAPKPPQEPDMNNLPANPIPKHQAKHALTAIKAVKRLKDAGPFLQPVDIVKLNIPLYYNYIPRPMDLSTIERKISVDAYERTEQVMEDFNLMVANCAKFNGEQSPIAQMARNIQASFEKHMLNMPPKDLPPSGLVGLKGRRKTATSNDVPQIRRDSTYEGGRPKREIHPPKPKDMPYDTRPRKKKYVTELRFCQQVLKELMSKKHESYSYPFLVPVDPVALDCPTYFDVIEEPMDLGTVQTKLSNNEYENADDFERDVRLVFKNCYSFNPEGSPVNMMGHRLEAVFDKKWTEKPAPVSSAQASEYESDEDDDDEEPHIDAALLTNPAIEYLEQQITRMQNDLIKMKKDLYDQRRKEIAKKRRSGKKTKSKKKKRSGSSSIYPTHITYDMKKEISEALNSVSENRLKVVLNIIREGMPDLDEEDEIELDMDQMDSDTLMKLYDYLVAKPKSSAKNGKKKKSLTHSEKIEKIKSKLEQFEKTAATNESSDDDDESESSEEE